MGDEKELVRFLAERLFPLMRSITGDGLRKTFELLREFLPLTVTEVATGTAVLDWHIPKEWVFRGATLKGPDGQIVCDARTHNLSVMNYSMPFRGCVSRSELESHLHSDPNNPATTPYVTSYYRPRWGFCLPHHQREALPDGNYEVDIDTDLIDGHLSLADCVLPGTEPATVFLSTYVCHPSMLNDELCGAIVLALLHRRLAGWSSRRFTYRFAFVPETIGSIAYLHLHGRELQELTVAGFNVCNVATARPFTFKQSRRSKSLVDRIVHHLSKSHENLEIHPFEPLGSDERQYCSPGFNLPLGALSRGPAFFPGYHSSADSLDQLDPAAVVETVDFLESACRAIEANRAYLRTNPNGEPHLSRYELYPTTGGRNHSSAGINAVLWVLNYGDGECDLLSIAERSGIPIDELADAATRCLRAGLLKEVSCPLEANRAWN